ncbi:MAG: TIGR03546 family protein [Elusimicrobia bacterium]|nr:TIGR03546 family protein [Elusimicrobiota bacterium]
MLRLFRMLAVALAAQDSPKQLAAGFALGAAAGLVPKTSLLSHLLLVGLAASQANFGAGFVAAALFALVGSLLDPLAHPIGNFLLTREFLKPLWTLLYNLPVVPWTEFNNTVVLGWFVLACAFAWPLYRAMIPAFEKYSEKYGERLRKLKVVQLLLGADVASKLERLR